MSSKLNILVEQIKNLSNDELKLLERFLTYGKSKYGVTTPLHINPTREEIIKEISSKLLCRFIIVMEDHITPDGKELKANDVLVFKYGGEVLHSDIVKQFGLSFMNTLLLEYMGKDIISVTISMPTSHPFYHNPEIVSFIMGNQHIKDILGNEIKNTTVSYFDEHRVGKWEDAFKSSEEKISIGETIYNYLLTYNNRVSESDKTLVINYVKSLIDESNEYIRKEVETMKDLIAIKKGKIAKERGILNINQIRYDSNEDLNDLRKMLDVVELLLVYKTKEEEFWWTVNQ